MIFQKIRPIRKKYFFVILLAILSFVSEVSAQKNPNVIFILTDQWRASALGYAGNEVWQKVKN